jgi:hypothetical protein
VTLGELGTSEQSLPESSVQRRSLDRPSEARPGWNEGAKDAAIAASSAEAFSTEEKHGPAHTEACGAC